MRLYLGSFYAFDFKIFVLRILPLRNLLDLLFVNLSDFINKKFMQLVLHTFVNELSQRVDNRENFKSLEMIQSVDDPRL